MPRRKPLHLVPTAPSLTSIADHRDISTFSARTREVYPLKRLTEMAKMGHPLLTGTLRHPNEPERLMVPPESFKRVNRSAERVRRLWSQGYTITLWDVAQQLGQKLHRDPSALLQKMKRRNIGEDIRGTTRVTREIRDDLLKHPEKIEDMPVVKDKTSSIRASWDSTLAGGFFEKVEKKRGRFTYWLGPEGIRAVPGTAQPWSYVATAQRYQQRMGELPWWAKEGERGLIFNLDYVGPHADLRSQAMTQGDVAILLKVSKRTVYDWCKQGIIKMDGKAGPSNAAKVLRVPFMQTYRTLGRILDSPQNFGFRASQTRPTAEMWKAATRLAQKETGNKAELALAVAGRELKQLKKRVGELKSKYYRVRDSDGDTSALTTSIKELQIAITDAENFPEQVNRKYLQKLLDETGGGQLLD